jgi:hypothetical protein
MNGFILAIAALVVLSGKIFFIYQRNKTLFKSYIIPYQIKVPIVRQPDSDRILVIKALQLT